MTRRRDRDAPLGGTRDAAAEAGLTLLEMVVVLAVIAVATGAATLALTPRRGSAAGAAAAELAATIQTATDRSLATGARETLAVAAGSYTVGGGRHALPAGVALRGAAAVLPIALDDPPFALAIAGGGERWRVTFDGLRTVAERDPA